MHFLWSREEKKMVLKEWKFPTSCLEEQKMPSIFLERSNTSKNKGPMKTLLVQCLTYKESLILQGKWGILKMYYWQTINILAILIFLQCYKECLYSEHCKWLWKLIYSLPSVKMSEKFALATLCLKNEAASGTQYHNQIALWLTEVLIY